MKKIEQKKIIITVLLIVLAILSATVVTHFATSTSMHEQTIQSLDDKKTTVMELTAASTAASAAITLIPGDTGTPIADKLADLSSYFLWVLCAIYLEKFLVTIVGFASFRILIPLALIIGTANLYLKWDMLKQMIVKMILFAFAIYLVIPTSVVISNLIDANYQASIEETIDNAENTTNEIENQTNEESTEDGLLSGLLSKVEDGVSAATTQVEGVLNNFIEALAVLLVTSCVIPILVIVFFVWLIKIMLGVTIPVPSSKREENN